MAKGWHNESRRHSLARKGVKTSVKSNPSSRVAVLKARAKAPKHPTVNSGNLVEYIMEYEGGNPTVEETLALFSYLIKTGQAWTLQGMYGRQAHNLIESGYIEKNGKVNWDRVENPKAQIYSE